MNKKGLSGGGATLFILALVFMIIVIYGVNELATEGNSVYGSTADVSNFGTVVNQSGYLVNTSQTLQQQFSGTNTTSSSGSVLGDSFNQVYTLGITSVRLIGGLPNTFSSVINVVATTLGLAGQNGATSIYQDLAMVAIVTLLIGAFLYILLGRNF